MKTSNAGIAFIERHEGVVLRAYRDPVGVWTIGAGLTSASGVVTPRPGMEITAEEARRLLGLALERNYEPGVARAMPDALQREFDAGVSFHFNTGAIGRASWVRAWRDGAWSEVERRLKLWNKGGGRVLPGLVRRRENEFRLLRWGQYDDAPAGTFVAGLASGGDGFKISVDANDDELDRIEALVVALGYDWTGTGIRQFQRDHDLAVDGIIGPATLATIQRRADANDEATGAAATATGGAAIIGLEQAAGPAALPDWLGPAVLAVALAWALVTAWRYRDVVAAKVQARMPRAARWLRNR